MKLLFILWFASRFFLGFCAKFPNSGLSDNKNEWKRISEVLKPTITKVPEIEDAKLIKVIVLTIIDFTVHRSSTDFVKFLENYGNVVVNLITEDTPESLTAAKTPDYVIILVDRLENVRKFNKSKVFEKFLNFLTDPRANLEPRKILIHETVGEDHHCQFFCER